MSKKFSGHFQKKARNGDIRGSIQKKKILLRFSETSITN